VIKAFQDHSQEILAESILNIWDILRRSRAILEKSRSLKAAMPPTRQIVWSWLGSKECEKKICDHYSNPRLVNFAIGPYLRLEHVIFDGLTWGALESLDPQIDKVKSDLFFFLSEAKKTALEYCDYQKNSMETSRLSRRDSRFFYQRYKERRW